MRVRNLLTTVLIIMTLFLAACSGNSAPIQTGPGVFLGGTDGVEVQFEPFSVLEDGVFTIFDTEDFPLEVIVRNLGEQNLDPGAVRLQLLGPAEDDFVGIPSWDLSSREEIEKRSEFNPEGDEELVSFTPTSYATYSADVIGFRDVVWNLNYDYDYQTHLVMDDICFKGDLTDDRVCEVREGKPFSVSGAPITVSSVQEDSAGRGVVLLRITVRNAGTGDATIPGLEFDDRFSQIAYTIDEVDRWECKSGGRENEARLIDGQAEIICRLREPLADDELFTSSVTMSFQYVYQDLIQETLRIKQGLE